MVRSTDGRFFETRIKVPPEELKLVLSEIKTLKQMTWKELAEHFEVSEYTLVSDWRTGKRTLPISIYKRILKTLPKTVFSKKENIPVFGDSVKEEHAQEPTSRSHRQQHQNSQSSMEHSWEMVA